jgi:hypothetical protein
MSEQQSIGEILNGDEPTEQPEAEAVEQPTQDTPAEEQSEAIAEQGPIRDERGRFAPKGDKEPEAEPPAASAPPAPQEEPGHIPIAALRDERSKRQALEGEVAQMRQMLERFQQTQQQPAPVQDQGPPDRWEDPEGYDQWLVSRAAAAAREEAINAYNYQRIETAAAQFRVDKPDYADVVAVFGQMTQTNPGLIQQMQSAPNPAEFAYNTAKLELEIREHGSIDALVEARLKAREAQALQSVQTQLPQSLPPTISNDRSVGSRSGPAWTGPRPIGDILS